MAMMKKLTSALVASSLVLSLVGTAAATTPDKVNTAAERMQALGLVQGKGGPDLALGDSITRAELVTVIVRAFGQESIANYLKGYAAFSDTANHWASGYIAMAQKLIAERTGGREVVGYPDGTFKPDQQVTAAEAIAFLMKFVGAPADASFAWPDNYLQGAVNAGLITAEDLATIEGIKNAPATRGLAFYLADNTFAGYKLAEGSTVYRTFVDSVGPALSIATQVLEPTLASKITITGTVSDAEAVFVGTPENAATIVDGTFTIDVDLVMGENTIVVTAVDLVGNTTERTIKVTRTAGPATAIAAEDITVAAGETVDVAAAVVDEVGNVLEGYTITGESELGTFADGKFTAGTKAGTGKLVLKAGDEGEFTKEVNVTVTPAALYTVKALSAFAPGKPVKLAGVDAYGNVIEGVTFSEDSADAYIEGDTLIVTKEGSYEITGTLGDVTVKGIVNAYGDVAGLKVEANKSSVVANGESTITITVTPVDANGNPVPDFEGYVRYEGDLDIDNDDEVVVEDDYAIAEIKDGVATFVLTADVDLADEKVDLAFALYEDYSDAEDGSSADCIADEEITVKAEEQEATSISLDAPEYLPVNIEGYETEVEVTILDQDGVEMIEADDYDLTVKLSGPALLIDEDGDEDDEAEFEDVPMGQEVADPFKIILIADDDEDTGTVTITVSSDDLKTAKATIEAVVARAAKSIKLTGDASVDVYRIPSAGQAFDDDDTYAEYTVQLVDRNGVPTSNEDDVIVEINLDGVKYSGSVFYADLSENDPEWKRADGETFPLKPDETTGKVKFALATMFAGTVQVTAEDADDDLDSSKTVTTEFTPGDAKYLAFKHDTLQFLTGASAETTVIAQLYDEYGNPVAKSGVEATIEATFSSGQVKINGDKLDSGDEIDVRTNSNGQIVLNVVTSRAVDSVKLEITDVSHNVAKIDAVTTPDPRAAEDDDLLFMSLAGSVTMYGAKQIADSIDVIVIDENGKKVSSVTPGNKYGIQITVKDDSRDPFDFDTLGTFDNQAVMVVKFSANHQDLTELYLPLVEKSAGVYRADFSGLTGSPSEELFVELPADKLDLDELVITAEILNVEKALSDSVKVKLADEHSTYKFVADSSVTAATIDWAIPFTVKYDKKRDLGYDGAKLIVKAYESLTKEPVNVDVYSGTTKVDTQDIDLTRDFSADYTIKLASGATVTSGKKYKIELSLIGDTELASKTITVTVTQK